MCLDEVLAGKCSMIDHDFLSFVLPVLEYCFAVWCSAADNHLKLLDRAVNGARFLTGGVFECDIAHRRSVAVLCMLHKIRSNQMHRSMMRYLDRIFQCPVTCGSLVGRTSVYLSATLLQNLAVPQYFCSHISVPLE